MSKIKLWKGKFITELRSSSVLIVGTNPEGRHGLGLAMNAVQFGLQYGKGRGLMGKTYGLVTKNLKAGFVEHLPDGSSITYPNEGPMSLSLDQLKYNIKELIVLMETMPDTNFLLPYRLPSNNLNGFNTEDIVDLFIELGVPNNIVYHASLMDYLRDKVKPI